jgi:hypothetical protein
LPVFQPRDLDTFKTHLFLMLLMMAQRFLNLLSGAARTRRPAADILEEDTAASGRHWASVSLRVQAR